MDGKNEAVLNGRGAGAPVLILCCAFLLVGMGRGIDRDRSADPRYAWIIGKQYQSKDDFVLYRHSGSKDVFLRRFGDGVPTRDDIGERFPYKHKAYGNVILGILPAGSIFEIRRVREEGSSSATFIYYYGPILSSEKEEFVGLDVSPIHLADYADPPILKEDLVEEVRPQ